MGNLLEIIFLYHYFRGTEVDYNLRAMYLILSYCDITIVSVPGAYGQARSLIDLATKTNFRGLKILFLVLS